MKTIIFCIILITGTHLVAQHTTPGTQPIELGKVSWFRSHDAALDASKKSGKPIFILFQEVPGCATCQNYGKNVLSHPLLVEIIENECIPLAVFNNKPGEDAKVLALYNEPSWNNPVVRIVHSNGENVIERVAGKYSVESVILNITTALQVSDQAVPDYLELWKDELTTDRKDFAQSTYGMYCFWSGEAAFGKLDGVLGTESVWAGFGEGVLVSYDKSRLSESELDAFAKENDYKKIKAIKKIRPDKDPQYYLKNSDFKYLALSPSQKSRINSSLAESENAENFLSPTQLKYYRELKEGRLKKKPVLYNQNFLSAWETMQGNLD